MKYTSNLPNWFDENQNILDKSFITILYTLLEIMTYFWPSAYLVQKMKTMALKALLPTKII